MTASETIAIYRSGRVDIDSDVFWYGFPERTGGVSAGLMASLNMGVRWGDDWANVEINRRRVAEAIGFSLDQLVVTKHVHGNNVWRIGEPSPEPPEFDGLVTDRPGVVLGAFAADCIPLVFADPNARVCGAAHAGWRGTVARVAVNVVERMVELGCRRADIRVVLGPCIGPCCFEVGDEVVGAFQTAFPALDGLVVDGPRKKHIDLRIATAGQLAAAGIDGQYLDADPPCTHCNPERFFSYRRDGRAAGMHMGFIGLRDRLAG